MTQVKLRKGDRVEYTWPNRIIGKPPFTGQGTVLAAHRNGSVTIKWDHDQAGVSKKGQWWPSVHLLTKL